MDGPYSLQPYVFNYSSAGPPEIIVNVVNPEWSVMEKYSDGTIQCTLQNCAKYIFGFTAEVTYIVMSIYFNNITNSCG